MEKNSSAKRIMPSEKCPYCKKVFKLYRYTMRHRLLCFPIHLNKGKPCKGSHELAKTMLPDV